MVFGLKNLNPFVYEIELYYHLIIEIINNSSIRHLSKLNISVAVIKLRTHSIDLLSHTKIKGDIPSQF